MPVTVKVWHAQDGIYSLVGSNLRLTEQEFLDRTSKLDNILHILGGAITDVIVVHSKKGLLIYEK
jgi:hypothetical protein